MVNPSLDVHSTTFYWLFYPSHSLLKSEAYFKTPMWGYFYGLIINCLINSKLCLEDIKCCLLCALRFSGSPCIWSKTRGLDCDYLGYEALIPSSTFKCITSLTFGEVGTVISITHTLGSLVPSFVLELSMELIIANAKQSIGSIRGHANVLGHLYVLIGFCSLL